VEPGDEVVAFCRLGGDKSDYPQTGRVISGGRERGGDVTIDFPSGRPPAPAPAPAPAGSWLGRGQSAPPPPVRTNRTRCVLHPVLIGHEGSQLPIRPWPAARG
jgi:hypothetical protein